MVNALNLANSEALLLPIV